MTQMLRNGLALMALRICLVGAEGSVDHAIKHCWLLEQLALGPELHRYPLAARIGVRIVSMEIGRGAGNTLQVKTAVLNTRQFTVVPREGAGGRQFYNVSVEMTKPLASTKMGPPGLMELEAEFDRGFTLVDKWLMLRNGERLMLSGPGIETSWRRAEFRHPESVADILESEIDVEHKLDAELERLHSFEHPASDAAQSRGEQEAKEKVAEDRFDRAAPTLEELKLLNELGALEADMRNKHANTAEVKEQTGQLLQQLESLKRNAEDAKPSTAPVTPPMGSEAVIV